MTDKTLSINVVGDISDVTGKLNDLVSTLDNIQDRSINVDVNVNDSGLESLNEDVNSTADNITGIGTASEEAGNEIDSSMSTSSTSIDEAASHASALGSQLDETATSADNVGNEMEQTGDTSVLAMGAATIAAAGLGLGLESVAQQTDDYNIKIGQLATMTGMAEGEMRNLIAHITNATFPTTEAIAYVKALEQAGVANEALADNATYMDRINDATGVGYYNVIKFSKSLQAMGADLSDINQYYNAIAYVNDRVIGGFEVAIQWWEKYDSSFKEMGLTVDETAVVIAAATQKFGGGRRAFQGVNTAINESNGDLAVFCEMIGLSADELANAGVIVGQYEGQLDSLADEESKHKSITQELGAIWEDLQVQFGEYISPLTSVASLMSGTASLFTGSAAALVLYERATQGATAAENVSASTKLKNIALSIQQRTAELAGSVVKKASAVATWLKVTAEEAELGNIVRIIAVNAALVLGMVAHKSATLASTAAQWLLNIAMSANPVSLLVISIAALVAGLSLLYFNNEQVRNSVNGLWESLIGFGAYIEEGLINSINAGLQPVKDLINGIENFGSDLYKAGKEWISNLAKGIGDSIPGLEDVLDEIGKYLPHSPAEKGALSEITEESMYEWGSKLGKSFSSGLMTNVNFEDTSTMDAWDFLGFLNSADMLSVTSQYREAKETQDAIKEAAEANQERIRQAYSDLNDLDIATTATYDKIAYAAMTNAEKIDYAFKVATHNATAYFYQLAEEASGAFSRMTSMLGSMGINLPETKYTPGQMLQQRTDTLKRLDAEKKKLKDLYERSVRGEFKTDDSRYTSSYEYRTQMADLEAQIKQLNSYSTTQAIMSAGQNVGSAWSGGVISGITSNTNAINNAAAAATQGLYGRSPPPVGPLKEIDTWGENVANAWIEGMETGLADLNIPLPSSVPSSSSSLTTNTVNINVDLDGANINSNLDAAEIGKTVGETLAEELSGQATNAGVSIVNIRR